MSPRPPDIDAAPSTSPKRWPWGMVLGLCLVGLGLSIMLERIHFKIHTQPDFQSFCAISRKVNCDVVARSKYALWLGTPVAAWGIWPTSWPRWSRPGACCADARCSRPDAAST